MMPQSNIDPVESTVSVEIEAFSTNIASLRDEGFWFDLVSANMSSLRDGVVLFDRLATNIAFLRDADVLFDRVFGSAVP